MGKKVAIIGGSGLYELEGMERIKEVSMDTPYGKPSDAIILCDFGGEEVGFLPRHGRGHTIMPSEVPSRANIYGLKKLGFEKIISISAVGSLKEDIMPLDFVVPDQIIDLTKKREGSFFGGGIVGHTSFADPFCKGLSGDIYKVIKEGGLARVHGGETYICIEGPSFSSRAESKLYRSWGCGVIGMTAVPEAKLAREAGMCYSLVGMVTDYDCWKEGEEVVSGELIVKNIKENIKNIKLLLLDILKDMSTLDRCVCRSAGKNSIITHQENISITKKKEIGLFYDKYLEI